MDLLDFDGEALYFEQPLSQQVKQLLAQAALQYGEAAAEHSLLQAYFLEPEHLTVLVALYRYFFYGHRYSEALMVADRAIAVTATQLGLSTDWRTLSRDDLERAVPVSMTLTRFLLWALKGSGYLKLRLDDAQGALERFEKVVEMDTSDRLGMEALLRLAREKAST
ncbi:hypothetical protein [Candidatus Thiosymbion oneisti]|uniref:hypothetical protein n=1 Tax=Candidatus Thiosymbion oneisti TaxID=589554 RepID=UPI000A91E1E2|nr:hypothetical protein [Candidatus Thiosymbion oneisti]